MLKRGVRSRLWHISAALMTSAIRTATTPPSLYKKTKTYDNIDATDSRKIHTYPYKHEVSLGELDLHSDVNPSRPLPSPINLIAGILSNERPAMSY